MRCSEFHTIYFSQLDSHCLLRPSWLVNASTVARISSGNSGMAGAVGKPTLQHVPQRYMRWQVRHQTKDAMKPGTDFHPSIQGIFTIAIRALQPALTFIHRRHSNPVAVAGAGICTRSTTLVVPTKSQAEEHSFVFSSFNTTRQKARRSS